MDAERQQAGSEARLEGLQLSKGFKPPESGPEAASPSQSGVPAAPAATYSAQSMRFLASGLLEYAHLATRLMADAVVVPAAADHCGADSNNHDAGPERGQPAEG